jgi:tetratricopeptide (TPR) repeat protein
LIHRAQSQLPAALAEFETAIRLNPKNAKAFGNLGIIFAEQGDLDKAEACFRRALRLNPTDQAARAALDGLQKARLNQPAAK